jgi:hypothetical protein
VGAPLAVVGDDVPRALLSVVVVVPVCVDVEEVLVVVSRVVEVVVVVVEVVVVTAMHGA